MDITRACHEVRPHVPVQSGHFPEIVMRVRAPLYKETTTRGQLAGVFASTENGGWHATTLLLDRVALCAGIPLG